MITQTSVIDVPEQPTQQLHIFCKQTLLRSKIYIMAITVLHAGVLYLLLMSPHLHICYDIVDGSCSTLHVTGTTQVFLSQIYRVQTQQHTNYHLPMETCVSPDTASCNINRSSPYIVDLLLDHHALQHHLHSSHRSPTVPFENLLLHHNATRIQCNRRHLPEHRRCHQQPIYEYFSRVLVNRQYKQQPCNDRKMPSILPYQECT